MTDIITAAFTHEVQEGRDPDVKWTVVFVDNESRSGKLVDLGQGNYALNKEGTVYYFSADKVIRLYTK